MIQNALPLDEDQTGVFTVASLPATQIRPRQPYQATVSAELLCQQMILLLVPHINLSVRKPHARFVQANSAELAVSSLLGKGWLPAFPRFPPLSGFRAGRLLESPLAKRVESGSSKSVDSEG